jgi:hypothetical protein
VTKTRRDKSNVSGRMNREACRDGMPRMRAVTISISLTDNYSFKGR